MSSNDDRRARQTETAEPNRPRKPWLTPEVVDLPKLTDLTLQTGSPIPGVGDPGTGSTVF
jgi:hypothetical protein